MPSRYTDSAGKKVWHYAGDDCSNPECQNPLAELDENYLPKQLGQIAHIHGLNEGSARYLASQSDAERRGFGNLIVLCHRCAKEVDGQGSECRTVPEAERRFPAESLKKWKMDRVTLVIEGEDMDWMRFPQKAVLYKDGHSIRVTYWIDRNGHERLFTAEQLAQVNQLQPLASSIREFQEMLDMIEKTEGKSANRSHQTMNDSVISQLYQRLRRLPCIEGKWLGYFHESLLLAQDVRLGEFLTMVSGLDPKAMRMSFERGRTMLKEKAEQTDPLPKITKVSEKK